MTQLSTGVSAQRSADQLARQQALAPDRSFCVLAPAGSGKTELLTQRLLKLLSVCEQPEHILAITFTRKAAGEMQHRLLASLRAAETSDISADAGLSAHERTTRQLARAALAQDNRQQWNLLQNPERLRLTTIDSFTSYLTARLPFATDFGARPELTTDTTDLFKQAIHSLLDRLDKDSALGSALAVLFPHLHNSHATAETLLLDLLKKRADWLPLLVPITGNADEARERLEANMLSLLVEQLTNVRSELLPYQAALMELVQFVAPYLAAQNDNSLDELAASPVLPTASAEAVPAWQALAALFLTKEGEFRKSVNKKQGFIAKDACKGKDEIARVQAAKEAFKRLTDEMTAAGALTAWQLLTLLPPARYSPAGWPVLTALLTILPALAAELKTAMQSAGLIDHVETSLAALRALGNDEEPTDLALRLDYQLHHILVDEFQDTSWTQFSLLEKLTAGWQPGDGRTLFIVGDGMQSCYGFRNADVSLFLRARDSGIGPVRLQPLQLSVNFRSDAAVVGWVNTVFTDAFPPHDDVLRGGVSYSASEASKTGMQDAGVRCQLFVTDANQPEDSDDDADDEVTTTAPDKRHVRQLEANAVAERCAQLRKQYPADSIAILVRNRPHLSLVVQALRARGLKWNASEIDRLLSYQEIMDLFSLLRALLNTADITAWLALLRSPLVGLALADLESLALAARQRQQSLWSVVQQSSTLSLSDDGNRRLQRAVPTLQRACGLRRQLPLRNLLELAWLELGGATTISDQALLPNIVKFFDLVEQYAEHDDIADIHAFATRLDASHGSAADSSVKLEIMTIHKAKGLQFDHVLLCGLDQKSRTDTAPLLRWQNFPDEHGRPRLLLGVKQQKGGESDALHDFLGEQDKVRASYELTRLLYIGVTRAIKTAWLYGVVNTNKKGEQQASSSSLLGMVLPVLLTSPEALNVEQTKVPAATASTAQTTGWPVQTLQRLPANWTSPLSQPLLATLPLEPETELDDDDNLQARIFGELVHFGLKQLVQQGPEWLEHAAGLPLWRRQLARSADGGELDELLQKLQQHLHGHLQSEQGRWLFSNHHQQDQCELALLDYRSGYRKSFVVDRTFVDTDGTRWIIDYKTATPAAGQALADFLAAEAQRYRNQLDNYRQLLAVQAPTPSCRIALYFTALGLLHELT